MIKEYTVAKSSLLAFCFNIRVTQAGNWSLSQYFFAPVLSIIRLSSRRSLTTVLPDNLSMSSFFISLVPVTAFCNKFRQVAPKAVTKFHFFIHPQMFPAPRALKILEIGGWQNLDPFMANRAFIGAIAEVHRATDS